MTKQECDLAAALNVRVTRMYSQSGNYRISEICKVFPDKTGRERGKKAEIMVRMEDEQRRVVMTYPENIRPKDPAAWENTKAMYAEKYT